MTALDKWWWTLRGACFVAVAAVTVSAGSTAGPVGSEGSAGQSGDRAMSVADTPTRAKTAGGEYISWREHIVDDLAVGGQDAERSRIVLPRRRQPSRPARVVGPQHDDEIDVPERRRAALPELGVGSVAALVVDVRADHAAQAGRSPHGAFPGG